MILLLFVVGRISGFEVQTLAYVSAHYAGYWVKLHLSQPNSECTQGDIHADYRKYQYVPVETGRRPVLYWFFFVALVPVWAQKQTGRGEDAGYSKRVPQMSP